MKCDECGAENPVVHFTQIENNEMRTFHLCEKCAAQKGLEPSEGVVNLPLADFLAQIGSGSGPEVAGDPEEACGYCGLTFADFRETGRLGCPHCYATFETYLRGLLRRVHGGTQHVGKVYLPPDPSHSEREQRLEGLKRKLARAVEVEDFERAAEIRDEIRELERVGS